MSKNIETTITSFTQILQLNKHFLSTLVFRGQKDSSWDLKTSIERLSIDFSKFKFVDGYTTEEKWMLHEFRRKSHLYSDINIPIEDKFEWLAIMQHHGAPTRLLDFTESIFIASFFAIMESNSDSSIWAINRYKIRDNLREKNNLSYDKGVALKDTVNLHQIDFANQFIAKKYEKECQDPTSVVPLESKLCSDRLAKQQGLFLMPTNSKKSFMANLESAFNCDISDFTNITFDKLIEVSELEKVQTEIEIIKINLPKEMHRDIANLLKQMNITAEVLFPGLDGLAKSVFHTQVLV